MTGPPRRAPSFGGFLNSPSRPSTNEVSADQTRSFEEWLKIASDNKINGDNTWNLALIDYFADMTLLRTGDQINFQKASYTLDGCVKVYTSRIDSVDSETKKLLLGLIDSTGVDKDVEEPTAIKRRKQSAKTLSDNASLSMESLEMDFAADPLFQKTAADFDEGGAKGLLLNHLAINSDGRIIFDASDVLAPGLETDTSFEVDMAGLRARFGSKLANLHSQLICPTFAKFKFNCNEVDQNFGIISNRDDFFYEPVDLGDFSDDDDVEPRFEMDLDNHASGDFSHNENESQPELIGREIREMINNTSIKVEDNLFAYFDQSTIGSAWAGPEYWKARLRKGTIEKEARAPPKRKVKKLIDFINTVPMDKSVLFARTRASLVLTKTTTINHHLLPVDAKFNSERLSRMFSNPSFTSFKDRIFKPNHSNSRKSSHPVEAGISDFESADVDGDNHNSTIDYNDYSGGFEDDVDDGDDIEYPKSLNLPEDQDTKFEFGDHLIDGHVRVKPTPLIFSKTAKRVDVQKLKENLWAKIDGDVEQTGDQHEKKFTEIVADLNEFYPEAKARDEISVAFCFICILHLANENNLTIVGDENMLDLVISH